MRLVPVLCTLLASVCSAQWGGRPDEAVVYLMTSKGSADPRIQPAGAANSPASLLRLDYRDPATLPPIPLENGFPPEFVRQDLHSEPDDTFQLVTQHEGLPGPHRIYRVDYKVLLIRGVVRETEVTEDSTAALATTLKRGANFGPDVALDTFQVLFWGPKAHPFPDVDLVPIGTIGPEVPPGLTGDEWIRTFGRVPSAIPWIPARRKFPGAGWPDGVDFKLIDRDDALGSTQQLVRLRRGARTPLIRIPGATHVYVLQGSVQFSAPGAETRAVGQQQYVFVPPDLAWGLSNPRVFSR
ncbi:MAG: hypothetical protein IPM24_03300 [Bryobacterales bacterium]|nr:hypothetical protein [Bryobacterales bacterium]